MVKSDFGEQVEPECVAHNGDHGDRLHNVYPLLYNACVHEAAERYCASGAFLFGRAGWPEASAFRCSGVAIPSRIGRAWPPQFGEASAGD